MAQYGAVRLDKVQGSKTGNLVSIKDATNALQNGMVAMVGALVSGEREVFTAVQPVTAKLTTDAVVLIASPEITYNAGETVINFVNSAGAVCRGYELVKGDIVTITDNVISGTTVLNQYVIPQNASNQLAAAADLTGATKFAAQVIEKTTLYGQAATVIRVVKNAY